MKDCLFGVLLLAIVSNAFEDISYFPATKTEINTESTEDYKSEIDALSTEPIKDHKQSSLSFNLTPAYKKLNELRNALDKKLKYEELTQIIIKLVNDDNNSTNPYTLDRLPLYLFDIYYAPLSIVDFLLQNTRNMFNNIFMEDLKKCPEDIKTIQQLLFSMEWFPSNTKIFLDKMEICLRNIELRIKESTTDKLGINTTESTENHKLEINTTEPTEDHKLEINITEPTENHKLEINTTEPTENHKLEINTTEPTKDHKLEVNITKTLKSINDHKPEINTTELTENHRFSLTDSLNKLNTLLYPTADNANVQNIFEEFVNLYVKNLSYEPSSDILTIPLIDLLLPERYLSSNEFLRQKYFEKLENPCNKARMIQLIMTLYRLSKGYKHIIYTEKSKNETYTIIKDCLEYLTEQPIQKLHTQSIESNVNHEITASTLKDNSKLKIPEVESEHENKNESTTVFFEILGEFKILLLAQKEKRSRNVPNERAMHI